MKYRKMYYDLDKWVRNGNQKIAILLGLRKTGKTTILQQLAETHEAYYVDFRDPQNTIDTFWDAFSRKEDLLLFDEIGYLEAFDHCLGGLDGYKSDFKVSGKKIIVTSSSYASMKQLANEKLGAGRCKIAELFPLSFEEYLYFSDRIKFYGEDYYPSEQDLQSFYRLENVPVGMEFILDREYFNGAMSDTEVAIENSANAVRDIELTKRQFEAIFDLLAYTLTSTIALKRFRGAQVGARELQGLRKGFRISDTLIGGARRESLGIGARDIARILGYLYHNGYTFLDLKISENSTQDRDNVYVALNGVHDDDELKIVLKKYNFCAVSPLMYTRLMVDIENIAEILVTDRGMYGDLYELAIKSEELYSRGYDNFHYSYKYSDGIREVDLIYPGSYNTTSLFLEATTIHKSEKQHSVDKIFKGKRAIRILTDGVGVYWHGDVYMRIGYPRALLMLSNDVDYGDLVESVGAVDGE